MSPTEILSTKDLPGATSGQVFGFPYCPGKAGARLAERDGKDSGFLDCTLP